MSRRLLLLLTVPVLAVMTLPVWAKSNPKDSLSTTITISSTASLNSVTLAPGEYKVVAEGKQAKFERDGKLVAEAPCTWVTLSSKPPYSEVMTDHNRITEIDFSGKTQAIKFPSNQRAGD
jgi:hypothetical protein